VAIKNLLLVSVTAGAAYAIYWLALTVLPNPLDLLATTAVALWLAIGCSTAGSTGCSSFILRHGGRQAAFAAARNETRVENARDAFLKVLKGWGRASSPFCFRHQGSPAGWRKSNCPVTAWVVTTAATAALGQRQNAWRASGPRPAVALAEFFKAHGLGVLVIGEGPALTTFVGVECQRRAGHSLIHRSPSS